MSTLLHDLRYGARMLFKQPGFTLVIVITLALGIGANTAIFSLLDAALLKSLPVKAPDRLVLFGNAQIGGLTKSFPNSSCDLFSYPFYQQVRQNKQDVFSEVASLLSITWHVHGTVNRKGSSAELERLETQLVSGTYFSVLGVNAGLGRTFTEADDQTPGGHPVAIVSHAWWAERLGSDPAAIGTTITIDQTTYTVIGVAPKEFFGTTVGVAPDLWIPLAMEEQLPPAHWNGRNDKEAQSLSIVARLKDGISSEQASAAVNLLFKQSLQDWAGPQPSADRLQDIQRATIELTPAGKGIAGLRNQFSLSLRILMLVVGVVLLIACANIANLLLARAATRQQEFAVRLAIGAGRLRLVRQLLTESVLLAGIGGILGIMLAWWGSRLLLVMASESSEPIPLDVTLNGRILGFTLLASLLSALIFGTAPALRAARIQPNVALKGGRGSSQSRSQRLLGKALVVAQVALSLLLLVGAGLFVRTLINLQSIPTGFNEQHVTLFNIDTAATGYKDLKLTSLIGEVETRVKALPGVEAASFSFLVFNQGGWTSKAFTREHDLTEEQAPVIRQNVVGSNYFTAMGIPLILGRGFGPQDTGKVGKVAVISETMARRVFPDSSPLGKRFGTNGPESRDQIEIVGVVKDVKYASLTEEMKPIAYYPHAQRPGPLNNFVVRVSGPPDSVIPQVRQTIKQVDNNLPINEVVSLSEHVGRSLVQQKLIARLVSFFGVLALLLASVGLYGILSYTVARRSKEIGIRVALGAQSRNVLSLILREALLMVGLGLAVGLPVVFATTRFASTLLFGLTATDPLSLSVAALLLVVVATIAGYLPARRATKVDPLVALRYE